MNELPKNLAYSLRFPGHLRHSYIGKNTPSSWQTDTLFRKDPYAIESEAIKEQYGPLYQREGFLAIQNAIAKAFIMQNSNRPIYMPEIRVQQFPIPAHTTNTLSKSMPWIIALIFLLSFNYTFVNTIRFIVSEKEKQLKEAMQIMGLTNWMHYLGWFIRTTIMFLISAVVISIMLTVIEIIQLF